MKSIAALIPVYNERETLPVILEKVTALSQITKVIVVDDCSTDGTSKWLDEYSHPKVTIDRLEQNSGKTAAINRAIQLADTEICVIQDADLEYDPEELKDVLDPIIYRNADVVYGSRFMVKKASRVLYFYHYLANKFLTFLSNLFTNMNMTDIETCYKAFRTDLLKGIGLSSKGFGMEVEITALIGKLQPVMYEVPISYYGRTYEEGKKIGLKDGIDAIFYILYYNIIYVRRKKVSKHLKYVAQKFNEAKN
tara:strand:- start:14965 stop:15717 length:753 start_codon:yes stop_codon:yes gene_type:complete